jgi:hypothetical protein
LQKARVRIFPTLLQEKPAAKQLCLAVPERKNCEKSMKIIFLIDGTIVAPAQVVSGH